MFLLINSTLPIISPDKLDGIMLFILIAVFIASSIYIKILDKK